MKRWFALVLLIVASGVLSVGQVGRDRLPSLDGLPDWAGGRPDVLACERSIGAIRRPDYRRLSVQSVDSQPLTQEQFDHEAGVVAPAAVQDGGTAIDPVEASRRRIAAMQAQLDHERAVGHALRLRRMRVNYVVGGTPAFTICQFRLIDGVPTPSSPLSLT